VPLKSYVTVAQPDLSQSCSHAVLFLRRTESPIYASTPIRWMCGVKLDERKKSEELGTTIRIETSQFDDQEE